MRAPNLLVVKQYNSRTTHIVASAFQCGIVALTVLARCVSRLLSLEVIDAEGWHQVAVDNTC